MKDYNAICWHKIDVLLSIFSRWHFSFWMYIRCFLRHVKLGKGCGFYGMTYFQRANGAKITVGDNCQFRSRSHSNRIGINHQCIVATMNQDAEISIGSKCGFSGTTITAFSSIKIGNNVRCGGNTIISDSDWHHDDLRSGGSKQS